MSGRDLMRTLGWTAVIALCVYGPITAIHAVQRVGADRPLGVRPRMRERAA